MNIKIKIAKIVRALSTLAILLAFFVTCTNAQNASPLGGVGSLQFFDNNGALLISGVVYVYQAGTSTQAIVYIDATGTTLQSNPVTFGSGARSSIWLANGTFVKIVLCVQNDGPFCAAGDILFTADQVPIGSSSSGGGGSSPFTGIFISSTASPATSGVLRLASGDSICWRNVSGSTNLCISKNSNDILSWSGSSLQFPEITAPTCGAAGSDCIWADNAVHHWKMTNNGGSSLTIPGVGTPAIAADLAVFAANGIDLVDGGSSPFGYKIECVNVTPVTVASTVALTPLQTCTIPANDIGAQTFYVDVIGIASSTATPTLTVGLYLDSILIGGIAPLTGSANILNTWTFKAFFTGETAGTTGTISGALPIFSNSGTPGQVLPNVPTNPITIDTTVSHVLQLKAQWGTSSASNTITSQAMTVYRVN